MMNSESTTVDLEEIEDRLHQQITEELEAEFELGEIRDVPSREEIIQRAGRLLQGSDLVIPEVQIRDVVRTVVDRMVGFGPLEALLEDPEITEIMVNDPQTVFIEREGRLEKTDITFRDDTQIRQLIDRMVAPIGRRLDESSPLVDARLPDGSRVNAITSPLAVGGPVLTIRKFSRKPFTLERLIELGTLNRAMADFLSDCILKRISMVISGGTGSGKTSTLNALGMHIPEAERIITIEDAAELQLNHPHLVSLESRPPNIEGKGEITIRTLVRNALRMRPDRIIVGEVRGGEAFDMLQAMNTGHRGSLTTLHANSPGDLLIRLESMVLMAGFDLPIAAIRSMIGGGVEVIVQQDRLSNGRRVITGIARLSRSEKGLKLSPLFGYEPGIDEHQLIKGT